MPQRRYAVLAALVFYAGGAAAQTAQPDARPVNRGSGSGASSTAAAPAKAPAGKRPAAALPAPPASASAAGASAPAASSSASVGASAPANAAVDAPPPPPPPGALHIEEAVRLALANNERSQKATLRVQVADGQLDRARDAFFPSLTAGGTGTLQEHGERTLSTSSSVTLNQPILNASSFPLYSQASHQLESERHGAAQDRRQLAYDTARAFVQALASERVAEAASRRLDRAQANLDDASARAAIEIASVNDVTRGKIDVASAQRDAATAKASVMKAYIQLGFLVGKRVEPPLSPPERTTRAASSFESTPTDQIRAALGRRSDVLSAHEKTEATRASAREPLYRLIPTLNAQAQFRALPAPLPSEKATDASASLNLLWTIFDSGFRYADRKTRLAQADSQALDESLLKRSVEVDVETAVVALRAARDSLRFAEEGVAAAVRNTEETQILYRQGLATALEMTDANAQRFDAEVSRESAKLSMEQAYLDLRFALGFGPVDDTNAPPSQH